MPHLTLLTLIARDLRSRWQQLRARPDAGYSTEAVLITALLVTVALAALAVIAGKIMEKANSINLN